MEMTHRAVFGRLAISAAAAMVFSSMAATSASAVAAESPHLSHGTNGQPNSSGAAKKVKESAGGVGALLTSVNDGYGVISVNLPPTTTLSQLTALGTGYEMTEGTCAGGAPRFSVVVLPAGDHRVKDAQVLWVYFGTQPYGGCTPQQGLATEDATQGDWWSGNSYQSYSAELASAGTDRLVAVQVAVDGGWSQTPDVQQALIQDLTIGINGSNTTFFPLPG